MMPFSVYPTGTTIYDPKKCWNGYTVYQLRGAGAILVDMNGRTIRRWRGLKGFPTSNKIMPGGYIMGSTAPRNPKYGYQDGRDLVQMDWNGKIVWQFQKYELVKDPRYQPRWMVRQHHDFQREGNPVGYYVPKMEPLIDRGNTIIVCHKNLFNTKISEKRLLDDTFIEVTWNGKITWEWQCSDHFDELGFSEAARNILARDPNFSQVGGGMGDWMHINSCSLLGPNKWYDSGDKRFHPGNLIWSSRASNILAITEKKTGNIIWKVGPDYTATETLRNLKQIIGPHHVHLIPRGLPGEGNILVYDNGGWAGYGAPNEGSPTGRNVALRDYTRVVEFDPITLKIIWQYPQPADSPTAIFAGRYSVYSPLMSSAQRLPNGNTLISEGNSARIIEVTNKGEIVWEFVNPYQEFGKPLLGIYRAYRIPYEWAPQAEPLPQVAVPRPDNSRLRVPGSEQLTSRKSARKVSQTEEEEQLCALPEEVVK